MEFTIELNEIENLPVDINIGLNWLSSNEAEIDLKNYLITLNERTIEIKSENNDDCIKDGDLIFDKVNLCENITIVKKIKDLSLKNPEVGTINSHMHEIHLLKTIQFV